MTHTDTGQKILVWWCLVWCEPHRSRSLQSSLCWAGCAVAVGRQLSIARAAKPKKGGKKKGGGGPPVPIPSSDSAAPDAYNQETRDIILSLDHVEKKSKDGSYILKDVCLGMYMGAKIGILGKNGAGKSTVMRILAGEDPEFLGDLTMDESIQIGYLPQEPVLEEETVIDVLEPAVKSVRDLVKQFEDVSMQMGEEDADIDALVEKMEILSCLNEVLGAVGQRVSCSQIPSIHEHRIASVHHHVWGSSLYYIHIIFTNIFSFLVFFSLRWTSGNFKTRSTPVVLGPSMKNWMKRWRLYVVQPAMPRWRISVVESCGVSRSVVCSCRPRTSCSLMSQRITWMPKAWHGWNVSWQTSRCTREKPHERWRRTTMMNQWWMMIDHDGDDGAEKKRKMKVVVMMCWCSIFFWICYVLLVLPADLVVVIVYD